MPNQVLSSPDKPYVEIILDGDQTEEGVNALTYEVLAQLDAHLKSGKPALVLVSLEKVGRSTPGVFDATLDILNRHGNRFERMAEYGAPNALVGRLTNYAIEHFGDPTRYRYFKTRDEAELWLAAGPTGQDA